VPGTSSCLLQQACRRGGSQGTGAAQTCQWPAPDRARWAGPACPLQRRRIGHQSADHARAAQITRICADQAGTIVRQPAAPNESLFVSRGSARVLRGL
jgi:hypothetical protein